MAVGGDSSRGKTRTAAGWLILAAIVGGIGLLIWNAYLRPYHGPNAADFQERIASATTCEPLYPIRREIDSATSEQGISDEAWQQLMDRIASQARDLEPQMESGETRLLCADLIVPCLPRGAVCYTEPP